MLFHTGILRRLLAACLLLASLLALVAPARSDQFEALKGKEIRAIIGGKPGAGTDLMGRAFFAALGRVLPETTIHIQTISGGAGAAAVKELAEATGNLVTVSVFGNGPIYSDLLATEAVPYDISKLQWLGSLASSRRVMSIRKTLGPTSFETLLKFDRQPLTPSSSAGSPNNIEALLINAITGLHLKVVPGFEDAQIETMLMAGDADVRIAGSFQIAPLIESGDMIPILRLGDGAYPESMKSLVKLATVALPQAPRELVLLMETLNQLGRPYAAAPGTDPAIVAALRAAFPIANEDPAFKEFMNKEGFIASSTLGGELQTALDSLLSNPNLRSIVRQGLECGKAMSEDPAATCY